MKERKITYTVLATFGTEKLKSTQNNFADVQKLVECVLDLGGIVHEIVVEEVR
jgi:hypothetical protein